MKKFIKLDQYGQLYIDKVLFESYFPIIFTCTNNKKDIFLCVCCQNNEKGCKWLLGKTDGMSIVKMLQDEITIRQLLLECSSEQISVDYVENEYVIGNNTSDWDKNSLYLPKEDSYMYAEDGEFEEEINYFSRIDDHVHYDKEYRKCIAKELGTINQGIEPIADDPTILASALVNILISSEIVRTLKVFEELCTNLVIATDKYMKQEKYKSVYNNTFNVLSEDLSIKVESDDNHYADAA